MQENEKSVSLNLELVASSPEVLHLKSGATMVLLESLWVSQDSVFKVYIDFHRVSSKFSALIPALKNTLKFFFKANSSQHASNMYEAFIHFLRVIDEPAERCTAITLHQVQQFGARLEAHESGRITTLNALLQKWFRLGSPGIEEECVTYLREIRKRGNSKGDAVRTSDPEKGPFVQHEYLLLYRAFDTAYGRGELPQWVIVLGRLLFAAGQRISQYASMKVCDFKVLIDGTGRKNYQIHIPQVKKGHAHARESFLPFDLAPQTGNLLLDYTSELFAIGFDSDAAFFPRDLVYDQAGQDEGQLQFKGHCVAHTLSRLFSRWVREFAPSTERLGHSQIPICPKRFRYTFGTRMVEEGCSKNVVAERLGHSDLQNVEIYFEASPTIVDNIDELMGEFLAPIAQAFVGRLIEGEEFSTHKGAPGTRIFDFKSSTSQAGDCGRDLCTGCGFDKPVACYTCFKFEPWLDGPHEKILHRLENERQRLNADPRVASINDDAILAIREVIAECNAVMAQRSCGESA